MRHRFFLVPTRADVPLDEAVEHWEQRHGAVFAATPHLAGYVQHQPTRDDQRRLGGRVCAEAWFAGRDDERLAFGSDHYRGAVTQDEARFVERSRAWAPLVVGEHGVGGAPAVGGTAVGGEAGGVTELEVVAVGCDPAQVPEGVAARILEVDRAGPGGGPAAVVIATVADEPSGRRLGELLAADVVFVARRNPVAPPPVQA